MISDDFSLNYSTKKISHASGSTRYTVNALYSWMMDLFDDASQMDDTVPIKADWTEPFRTSLPAPSPP